ncbi:MAG: hypothetical protein IKC49_03435 [Clostridia bacterium]|nr:hypothetical protein [Clostridia bacterium]
MKKHRTKEWERQASSLYRIDPTAPLEECKNFSRENITKHTTKIDKNVTFIELDHNSSFCFLGRVDTNLDIPYDPTNYYKACERRTFMSFSTITDENISHYKNSDRNYMFIYDMPADAIVHVYPCDADTDTYVNDEEELTRLPSLWLTLNELNEITLEAQVYNQVTCRTKDSQGNIIKPIGLLVFDEMTDEAMSVADRFGVPPVLVHPKKNAINFSGDIMYDDFAMYGVSTTLKKRFGIDFMNNYYIGKGDDYEI